MVDQAVVAQAPLFTAAVALKSSWPKLKPYKVRRAAALVGPLGDMSCVRTGESKVNPW